MFFFRTNTKNKERKIVIVGAGEVGYHVALRLSQEHKNVIIIDINQQALSRIEDSMDVQTIYGSGSSPKVLHEVGLQDNDLFLTVTDSDESNILSCLFANTLAPGAQKLARIRNTEYITHTNILQNTALNISALVNPERAIVRSIDKRITLSGAVDYGEFAEDQIRMVAMKIKEGPLLNIELKNFRNVIKNDNVMVGAIARNNSLIIPSGDDSIEPSDIVYFIYLPSAETALLQAVNSKFGRVNTACIVGGGNIGVYMARTFAAKGMNVQLVEQNAERCHDLASILENVSVLHGDGTDKKLFEDENVGERDVFVALTGDEKSNIISCLLAKSLGVREGVARVNKPEYLSLLENIGIDHSVSLRHSAVNSILQYVRQGSIISCVSVGDEEAEIIEALVKETSSLVGKSVRNLGLPKGVLLLGIMNNDNAYIPTGETVIESGNRILLLALRDLIGRVEKMLF